MFCVGQKVLYGANGVCTIDDVTEKSVGDHVLQYYVLKPVASAASTLFVPTANEQLVGKIRNVLTADEAKAILADLPDCGAWTDDKTERSEHFKSVISSGDCVELIRMIRLLKAHEAEQVANGKRLHISDERFLKEAEKMVGEELAIVLGVERGEVLPLILK